MPIAFKSMNGIELFKKLKIAQEDWSWLHAHKFDVDVFATEIRFKGQVLSTTVPVKIEHLSQLKNDDLGQLAFKTLRMGVLGAIKQLRAKVDQSELLSPMLLAKPLETASKADLDVMTKPAPPVSLKGTGSIMAKLNPLGYPPEAPNAKVAASGFGAWPENKMTSATPVPLAKATLMYQPVQGSSAHSRYFLIAANDGLRIAARIKGASLSLRIEGSGFADAVPNMVACGFTNLKEGYASMHLQVEDPLLMNKTVGAVLMGLGVKLSTPMPDMKLLINKGS